MTKVSYCFIMRKDGETLAMFRPIRRKIKEIAAESAEKLLEESRRGVLAVNGDNGYPYAVPINYSYDKTSGRIYFHGARAGHKFDSIKADPKVCFTVYGNETVKAEKWAPFMQSVVVFGKCRLIEDQDKALELCKKMAMKYYPDEKTADEEIQSSGKAVQMFEIEIEHMSGKEIQEK